MKKTISMLVLMLLFSVFSVTTAIAQEQASLQLNFISQTPDPVQPGQYVELRWRVTNLGGSSEDFTFELRPDFPFSLDPGTSPTVDTTSGSYENTDSGAIIYYRVRVDPNAVEGVANIDLAYYREGSSGTEVVVEQPVRIQDRQGLIEVSAVNITPSEVSVGTEFDLEIDISNKGSSFISDVKVEVDTDETSFTPIGSTNRKIIKQIAGNQMQAINFNYFVDANAEIKVHSIPLTITYFDSLGRESVINTKFGIPVKADSEYLFNLQQTDLYQADQYGRVVVSISNIGKSDLNFVVLELEESDDYVITSSPKEYLGNLESDDFETGQYEIYINPTEKTSIPLKFSLHYRDAYDRVFTEVFTLNNRLYTAEEAVQFGKASPRGSPLPIIIFLVIVAGVIFWWYKARKNKKQKR